MYTELSGVKGASPDNFHYCQIIALADSVLPPGVVYFIPAGSFGFAAWEDSAESTAEYHPGQDNMWLTAKVSWGAVVLDPKSIFAFKYKP